MSKKINPSKKKEDELLELTNYAIDSLRRSNPIMSFIGITGILCSTIIFVSGILFTIGLTSPSLFSNFSKLNILIGIILIVGSVLMFLPSYFLIQSSKHLKMYFNSFQSENLEVVLFKQKQYYKYIAALFLLQFIVIFIFFVKNIILGIF